MMTVTVLSRAILTKAFRLAPSGAWAAMACIPPRSMRVPTINALAQVAAATRNPRREVMKLSIGRDSPSLQRDDIGTPSGEFFCRDMNRGSNTMVSRASTDNSVHRIVDIGIRRRGNLGQQADRRHDLSGLAITALDHIQLLPR